MGPVDQSISAGLGGFFALFLLAAALWLLMRSLLRHLRNAEHHLSEERADEAPGRASVAAGAVHTRPSRTDGVREPAQRVEGDSEGPRTSA